MIIIHDITSQIILSLVPTQSIRTQIKHIEYNSTLFCYNSNTIVLIGICVSGFGFIRENQLQDHIK